MFEQPSLAGLSRDFWSFWAGQAVSTLGSSFTVFAIPLLIFQLTGSALNLSLSMALGYLPAVTLGLLAGAWVDRVDRKRLMLVVNLLFAVSVVSIPVVASLGHLSIVLIYAVQVVNSTLRLFFQAATAAAIPSLVPKDRLVAANGRIQASYAAMSVLGPLLAGGLATLVPLPSLLLVDAASYLISAAALLLVRTSFNEASAAPPLQSVRAGVAEGLRFIWSHPVLRNISLMIALVNFFSLIIPAQLVYFAKIQLHADNGQIGLLFAANAVGVFLLSLVAGPLRRHWPFSRVALGLLEIQGFVTILMAQIHVFWAVLPLMAIWQGLGMLFTVNTTSIRQVITPNYLLGRVAMTAAVIASAVIPVGTLLGGLAIQRTGNISMVFTVAGAAVFILPMIFSFTGLGHAERHLPMGNLEYGRAAVRSGQEAPGRFRRGVRAILRRGAARAEPSAPNVIATQLNDLADLAASARDAAQGLSAIVDREAAAPTVEGMAADLDQQLRAMAGRWSEIREELNEVRAR